MNHSILFWGRFQFVRERKRNVSILFLHPRFALLYMRDVQLVTDLQLKEVEFSKVHFILKWVLLEEVNKGDTPGWSLFRAWITPHAA